MSVTSKKRRLLPAADILAKLPTLKRKTLMYAARRRKVYSELLPNGRRVYDVDEVENKLIFTVLPVDQLVIKKGDEPGQNPAGELWAEEHLTNIFKIEKSTVARICEEKGITRQPFAVAHPIIRRVFIDIVKWRIAYEGRNSSFVERSLAQLMALGEDELITANEAELLGVSYWVLNLHSARDKSRTPAKPRKRRRKNRRVRNKGPFPHPALGRLIITGPIVRTEGNTPIKMLGYRIGDVRKIKGYLKPASAPAEKPAPAVMPDSHFKREQAMKVIGTKSMTGFFHAIKLAPEIIGEPIKPERFGGRFPGYSISLVEKFRDALKPDPKWTIAAKTVTEFPGLLKSRSTIHRWAFDSESGKPDPGLCPWLPGRSIRMRWRYRRDDGGRIWECIEYSRSDLHEADASRLKFQTSIYKHGKTRYFTGAIVRRGCEQLTRSRINKLVAIGKVEQREFTPHPGGGRRGPFADRKIGKRTVVAFNEFQIREAAEELGGWVDFIPKEAGGNPPLRKGGKQKGYVDPDKLKAHREILAERRTAGAGITDKEWGRQRDRDRGLGLKIGDSLRALKAANKQRRRTPQYFPRAT